jgi:hypothetical protein
VSTNRPKDAAARKAASKFARALLATTCLTVASGGAAMAGGCTFAEGGSLDSLTPPVSPTQLTATPNPGVTTVCGADYTEAGAYIAFWELTGLGVGNYMISAYADPPVSENVAGAVAPTVYGDLYVSSTSSFSGDIVDDAELGQSSSIVLSTTVIPANGDLFFTVALPQGAQNNQFGVTVTTTAPSTPEPSTVATTGLGLAGALALWRKRRRQ